MNVDIDYKEILNDFLLFRNRLASSATPMYIKESHLDNGEGYVSVVDKNEPFIRRDYKSENGSTPLLIQQCYKDLINFILFAGVQQIKKSNEEIKNNFQSPLQ